MELPPPQVARAVIQRYARILQRYGSELGTRPLVLPNADFFPDPFEGDQLSVEILCARMQEYAGLADIPIRATVVVPGTVDAQDASCKSGACGIPQLHTSGLARLIDEGESWLLQVPSIELRHPVALTTNLARSLSFVFLVETQREGELLEPPVDVTADLVAVALGFGVLMLQGSYIYAKSCGGPQIASVTKVSVSELAIAVALFAELSATKLNRAPGELEVTQRTALTEALRLMRGNRRLAQLVKAQPAEVAAGHFEWEEPGSFLSTMLGRFLKKDSSPALMGLDSNMDLDELESLLISMPPSSRAGRALSPSRSRDDKEKDELKNLVAQEFR